MASPEHAVSRRLPVLFPTCELTTKPNISGATVVVVGYGGLQEIREQGRWH